MAEDRRRTVLFVDHASKVLGGAEINLIELAGLAVARQRWNLEVACAPGSPLDEALAGIGVRRRPHFAAPALNELRVVGRRAAPVAKLRGWLEMGRMGARLAASLRAQPADVVISCANKDHFAAAPAARSVGAPSVWWVNDTLSADFFSWPVRRVFVARARRFATRLAPVSRAAGDALVRAGVPEDRVRPILNGIPLERYRRRPSSGLAREIGAAPNEPLFGILGRITPWKGQELFLKVARRWRAAGRPGRFLIVGRAFNEDAPFEAALRQRAGDLAGTVHFVPHHPEVVEVLSGLTVALHCSLKPEPFGRVIIEAMAAGAPVVAADAGGAREIVADGATGLLARPGDDEDYATKLALLMESPGRRAAMAAAAVKAVEDRFTVGRVFSDFDRLIGEVLPDAA